MFNQLAKGKSEPQAERAAYQHQEFPKGLHHPEHGFRVAKTPEEAEAMQVNGWLESPSDFPEVQSTEPALEHDPSRQTEALQSLSTEIDDLKAAAAKQAEENLRLTADNKTLRATVAELAKKLKKFETAKTNTDK